MPNLDDDLDSISSSSKKSNYVSKVSSAESSEDENLDVDFGDQKLMARTDGLNRVRPMEKGKVSRFALLDFVKPKSTISYFVEGKDKKGTFRPADEKAAAFAQEKLGDGQLHVVALVLHYTNADNASGSFKKDQPIDWEIAYVDLSKSNYSAVSNLAPEDSSVYDIDILMSKKVNGIGYDFTLKATTAKWKTNPDLVKEVKAAAQKFVADKGAKLAGKLGKKLDLAGWKSLLSGQASSSAEATLDDIGDLEL